MVKANKKINKKTSIKTNKKTYSNVNGNVNDGLAVLEHIMQNAMTSRSAGLARLLNLDKDINYECGYPESITTSDYRAMYNREGVGNRVVRLFPEESWAMLPKIEENQDEKETAFEKEWKDMEKQFHLFHYLRRIDMLSGIGRFGILLLGINDGKKLFQPIKGINPVTGESSAKNKYQLLYLRPFDESVVTVKIKETDTNSPRFGCPVTYGVDFKDSSIGGTSVASKVVHWTRVLHVVDNREVSEIYGVPRMRPVYNRLLDLRKIVAGSGEMFWKGGFPGMALELGEGMTLSTEDKKEVRAQIKDYQDGLQRWLSLAGLKVHELKPQIADPQPHIKSQMQYIACTLGIPYRIFMGSEAAHLASTEDKETWNKRVSRRQEDYVSPMLIRLLIDRLMMLGALSTVEEYFIEWPDLSAPGEKEIAEIAAKKTEALAKYIGGDIQELIPPKEYFTKIMEMSEEDAEALIKAADKFTKKLEKEFGTGIEDGDENEDDEVIEEEDGT